MVKDNLTKELNMAVKNVQLNKQLQENDCFLTSDEASRGLVTVLEAIFIHGVRESFAEKLSSAFGDPDRRPTPEFWSPMMIFTHGDTINQVSSLSQITTDVGRSRSWIRLSLNEGLFLGYLLTLSHELKTLKPYYKTTAYLLDHDRLNIAITYFQGLSQFKFKFPINSSVLNVWTNETLLMAGCWTPPMKEGPISSGMDVVKSLPDDDSDTMSVSSSSASQKLLLNDDEALKIILNTPTESSPIMERMKSESKRPKQKEMPSQGAEVQDAGGSKDTDGKTISTPAIDLQDPTEAQVSKNKEDESAAQESTTAESEWTETSDDDVGTEKTTPQISTMMSYDTLLESYLPQAAPLVPEDELKKILKNYSQLGASDEPVESAEEPIDQMYESGFEIVEDASPSTKTPEFKYLVELLRGGKIIREPGLDSQGFSCKSCGTIIGISPTKPRVCSLSGLYYCTDCFKNFESVIPGRIIHNWDFMKYPVSPHSCEFLTEVHMHPLINIRATNPKIYFAVDEMNVVRNQRMKLNLLRQYLFTCHDTAKNRLQNILWPREYLYEHVHLYSIMDLMETADGTLQLLLKKAITISEGHVRSCALCSQKGFICELCRKPDVPVELIFPFDVDRIHRCTQCKTIYHLECMKNAEDGCPKCSRIKMRKDRIERNLSVEI
ncbi:DUF4206 [Nesidiocoris tenuis]|uniref:DUF4206 n=1 Tax=Nesidiocoris tenuis TaxID=355587 RepID=A0ABN7B0H3_9HEMI|nr:DUF4206 [Nesidiocoris tenuis]